jgi:Cu+-exporting ATPase
MEVNAMAIDPVCGMDVDEGDAGGKGQYEGKTYYFCSSDCKREFQEAPESYAFQEGEGEEEEEEVM